MKIEIEHEGSCLGATGGTGRLIVTTNLSFGEWSAVFGDAKSKFNCESRRAQPEDAVAVVEMARELAIAVRDPELNDHVAPAVIITRAPLAPAITHPVPRSVDRYARISCSCLDARPVGVDKPRRLRPGG
jgi:hypothetical protein